MIDSLPLDLWLIIIQFIDPSSFMHVSTLINKRMTRKFNTLFTTTTKWSLPFLRVSSKASGRMGRGLIQKYRSLIQKKRLNIQHLELGACGRGFLSCISHLTPTTLTLDFSRDIKGHLRNCLSDWFESTQNRIVKLNILSLSYELSGGYHYRRHVPLDSLILFENLHQLREVTLYRTKTYPYSSIVQYLPTSIIQLGIFSSHGEALVSEWSCYECSFRSLDRFKDLEVLDLQLHEFGLSTLLDIDCFPRLRAMRLVESCGPCHRVGESYSIRRLVVFPSLEELVIEGSLIIDDILFSSGKNIRYLTILPPLNTRVDMALTKTLISTFSKLTHLICPVCLVPDFNDIRQFFFVESIGVQRLRRVPDNERVWPYG